MGALSTVDKLHKISAYFKDGVAELEQDETRFGLNLDLSQNDHVFVIARNAIEKFMPELVALTDERVRVGSELGICLSPDGRSQSAHSGIGVLATFRAIKIKSSIETLETSDGAVTLTNYDLYALLIPKFADPDPVDIISEGKIFVPFGQIEAFEAA